MHKKILISALGITLLLSVVTALFFAYQQRVVLQPNQPSSSVTPTPEPFSLGKTLIVSNLDTITEAQIEAIKKENYNSMLVEDATDEVISNLETALPTTKIFTLAEENSSSEIKKCKNNNISESNNTDSQTEESLFFLSRGDCSKEHKITDIIEFTCLETDRNCLTAKYQPNLHSAGIVYNKQSIFMSSFSAPSLTVEQQSGFPIITWATTFPNTHIQQGSYSIELQDSQKKRIFASGKINQTNQGDYYIPTTNLVAQDLTVILRVWYTLNGKPLDPQSYTTTFAYTPAPTTPMENLTSVSKQIAWIPDWGMKDGIASVQKNPKKWASISPVWFTPNNKNGGLNKEPTYNNATLLALLRKNKIKIIPTITSFDADILKEILRKYLDVHVQAIVNEVVKSNYDGIDLDYESTYMDDKALLTEFVTKLATALHAKGKTLAFTALPKVDDRQIYAFLPQTHQAQDWKAIGAVVDEFRIMAYDFTGQGSGQPGPLSPLKWNEILIQYAIANMPKEKVVLALPLYSHAWPKPSSSNIAGTNNDKTLASGLMKNTISLQHDEIAYVKSHSTYYRETYDNWNKEARAEFKYKGIERVMYYLNKKAIDERIELGKKYGIAGICYWRIGGETL